MQVERTLAQRVVSELFNLPSRTVDPCCASPLDIADDVLGKDRFEVSDFDAVAVGCGVLRNSPKGLAVNRPDPGEDFRAPFTHTG